MSLIWALQALRWSFCAFIVFASAQAFAAGPVGHGASHLGGHGLFVLSGAEAAAALAQLIPRLRRVATGVLCVVFAIAAGLTAASGEIPLRFVYYAATAVVLGLPRSPSLWPQAVSTVGA